MIDKDYLLERITEEQILQLLEEFGAVPYGAIKEKEIQLSKLEQHIEKSNTCAEVYNKVILEKAILNKELSDMENNTFVERVKQLIPHKKTLICDYFKK